MTIEEFISFVKEQPHFKPAVNLSTHLHIIEWNHTRILSYFNQPILVEMPANIDLVAEHMLNPTTEFYCLPFPCMEVFCPSFNAKTSMLVDLYKVGVIMCKKQFKDGLPEEFMEYNPKSIKCEPPRSTKA